MKIGIDIGGSHIGIAVILDDKIIEKKEIDILSKVNIKEFIEDTIVFQINEYAKKYEFTEIGIAVPGIVKNNKIDNLYNLGISNYDIIERLNVKLDNSIEKITLRNDGVCASIAEMKFGNLKSYNKSIFLCFGTGIGGAICEDGEVIPSEDKLGFEFGHMQILNENYANVKCNCGKSKCFEIVGSIKKLKLELKRVLEVENIEGQCFHDLIVSSMSNQQVEDIINKYIKQIAYGICKIACITEPEAICIGGGFSYYKDILFEKLINEFSNFEFEYNVKRPIIVMAKYENDAGMIGSVN